MNPVSIGSHGWVTFLFLLLSYLPLGYPWGEVGHKTVAAIAKNYLTHEARAYVQRILLGNETLVSVATWADDYRKTPQGRFSRLYHFIDAEDHPPSNCSVYYKRDCHNNDCIISATKNYTERIQNGTLPREDTNQALKFLIHFLGDITQPLHDEAEAFGGNLINVTWNGAPRRLHGCWDDEMVERDAGGNSAPVIANFAAKLTEKIDTGFFPKKGDWISCIDPASPEQCSLEWALDANQWNCEYVLKTNMNGQELNGTYYVGAQRIIEEQIAKGGYRLGHFLNNLAAANTKYPQELRV